MTLEAAAREEKGACRAVCTYLEPVHAEDRAFMVVGMSRLCLALWRYLIEADFLVPAGDCEEVLL